MSDISIFFSPVELDFNELPEESLGKAVIANRGEFYAPSKGSIALFFVPEYRNLNRQLNQHNPSQEIRTALYRLFSSNLWNTQLYDLGDLRPGERVEDTYYALEQIVAQLIKNKVMPVIIGGSQDLSYAQYQGYKNQEQLINIVNIDAAPDIGAPSENLMANNWLQHILLQKPNHLFNYSNIGTQKYFVAPRELDLIEKLYFDICRLGELNKDLKIAEPHLRNADLLTIDLLSMRNSDFPRSTYTSPNGFYAEQICQIARYAGFSDKTTSIGIYNYFNIDEMEQNPQLVAQIIWHILDGFNNRVEDFPIGSKKDYQKYRVALSQFKDEIVFYKSPKSNRWWIEVPFHPKEQSKFQRHYMVPCNYEDYQTAMQDEVPDLWWKTYQKIFV